MDKEKRVLLYWCPTCKKLLTVETDSPIYCGAPICVVCDGQVWRKTEEWVAKEKSHGRIING